jgi:PAS domain S-box-containing protein
MLGRQLISCEEEAAFMDATKGIRKVGSTEDRCKQLLHACGVALVVSHGVEQDVEIVNDRFTGLFGYTMEDIPDVSHWWPLAYPDETYREAVKAEWQRRVAKAIANNSEIEPMEAKVRCKDGSERYIEFHFSSIGDTNLVSFVDLTERTRAETALRESEERFRLMADTAPVLMWMSGTDKLCTYFNKSWLDFTGRLMEQELGNGWAQGVHPEDLQPCLDTYRQSFDRRAHFRMEYRLRHRNGEYRWVLDIGVPRFNQDGSFAGYIGAVVDISERKMAEESSLRLATIVESSEDAIISKTLDGVIVSWNKGAQRIFGYAEAEAVGKPIATIIPPELVEEENRILAKLRAGVHIEPFETVRITKAGKKIDVSLSVSPIMDSTGTIVGASKIARDITERKMAEKRLRESEEQLHISEERLRLAQKVARIGTFEWNLKTGVNTWTGELEAMYGLCMGAFGRTQSAFEKLIHPDDRANVVRLVDSALKSGEPTEGEWRVVSSDQSVHWIVGRWQVFMDESGQAMRMIGVNVDVTQRKQAEEALWAANRKLLEAQEQERARIGRELHDDINQRLAMLALELEELQENPAEVGSRLQELRGKTVEISGDVQALSHELHSSRLEYLGVVKGLKSWCEEFAQRQRLEIDFKSEVSSVLPHELGICFFRVLQEALHNAVKHSGAKRIEVELREHSNEFHLIIHDSGRGFDVEAAMQGHGLGLTSMQERVRLVNGTITIQSRRRGGTTIHACIPFRAEHDSQRAAG